MAALSKMRILIVGISLHYFPPHIHFPFLLSISKHQKFHLPFFIQPFLILIIKQMPLQPLLILDSSISLHIIGIANIY